MPKIKTIEEMSGKERDFINLIDGFLDDKFSYFHKQLIEFLNFHFAGKIDQCTMINNLLTITTRISLKLLNFTDNIRKRSEDIELTSEDLFKDFLKGLCMSVGAQIDIQTSSNKPHIEIKRLPKLNNK